MAFDVALTFAQRDNLYSLQRTEDYQDRTQRRLASGREVNDVTDDVFRYFAARSLSERADEFIEYNEQTEQAIINVKTAIVAIESIRDLFKQIKGIVQGSAGKTTPELKALDKPLSDTLKEAGQVLVDGQYQGTRFIYSDTETLTVRFSERFTIAISGKEFFDENNLLAATDNEANFNGEILSIATDLKTVTPFVSRLLTESGGTGIVSLSATSGKATIINQVVQRVNATLKALNNRAVELGIYVGVLQIRHTFTEGYTKELKTGTDAYTLADINQEGAYLVALQTRQQLALNGLAVSGRQQAAVLTLLQ